MTRTARIAVATLFVSGLPLVLAVGFVRPAAAGDTQLARYALTGVAAAVRTDGTVGASGGLAPLDSGGPSVSARLDDSPSASVIARPVDVGTLARTVLSQGGATNLAPEAVAGFPGSPGATTKASSPVSVGPLTLTPTGAAATASAYSAAGMATTGKQTVTGVDAVEGARSTVTLSATASPTGSAGSAVTGIDVAGVLRVDSVVGAAAVARSHGLHTASAGITVSGADVAGTPLTIDAHGVRVAGVDISSAPALSAAASVAHTLAVAGVTISVLEPLTSHDANSAFADSGGLQVTVVTPTVAAQPGNTVVLTFGRVTATLSDAPALPAPPTPSQTTSGPAVPPPGPVSSPGPVPSLVPPPSVVPTPVTAPTGGGRRELIAFGHRLPAIVALMGLGCWQLFTLSGGTLMLLFGAGRRQEYSCPCPTGDIGGAENG